MKQFFWAKAALLTVFRKPMDCLIVGALLTAAWVLFAYGVPAPQKPANPPSLIQWDDKPAAAIPRTLPAAVDLSGSTSAVVGPPSTGASLSTDDGIAYRLWIIRIAGFFPWAALIIGAFRFFDGFARKQPRSVAVLLSGFSPLIESAIAVALFAIIAFLPACLIFQVAEMLRTGFSAWIAAPFYAAAFVAWILFSAAHIFIFSALADGRLTPVNALHSARRRAVRQPVQAVLATAAAFGLLLIGHLLWTVGLFFFAPLAILIVTFAGQTASDSGSSAIDGSAVQPTDWRATGYYRPSSAAEPNR